MRILIQVSALLALVIALFIPFAVIYPGERAANDPNTLLAEPVADYWNVDPVALGAGLIAAAGALLLTLKFLRSVRVAIALCTLVSGSIALTALLDWYSYFSQLTPPNILRLDLGFWLFGIGLVLVAWQALEALSGRLADRGFVALAVPIVFGLWLLFVWEVVVVGFRVPQILLPAPSQIGHQLASQVSMLWEDFQQTFLKSVLAGFAMGCGLGFVVAVLTDRVPFLQRGLLPLGNMVSAVPIVGIAPIMVMWFGFGWESKAAVIVVMTFFPMLINTIAGLNASDHMERDLMRSYGSSYWQTFFMLRLPAALPFIFNALKINSTLALIGAIVAEMFGSPISGMGFRISTEVYKMNVDIVWATIAVAAVAGSAFYGLLALIERQLTFWHPSYRSKSYA